MDILSDKRNKRALIILVACVAFVGLYSLVIDPFLGHWQKISIQLEQKIEKVDLIESIYNTTGKAAQARLNRKVPAFAMPQVEDKQRMLFAKKIDEQIKKTGIKLTSQGKYLSKGKRQTGMDLKLLALQYRGKGQLNQIIDLLDDLKNNPYLVGIEEIKITCGKKNRNEMDLALTISTLTQL